LGGGEVKIEKNSEASMGTIYTNSFSLRSPFEKERARPKKKVAVPEKPIKLRGRACNRGLQSPPGLCALEEEVDESRQPRTEEDDPPVQKTQCYYSTTGLRKKRNKASPAKRKSSKTNIAKTKPKFFCHTVKKPTSRTGRREKEVSHENSTS